MSHNTQNPLEVSISITWTAAGTVVQQAAWPPSALSRAPRCAHLPWAQPHSPIQISVMHVCTQRAQDKNVQYRHTKYAWI